MRTRFSLPAALTLLAVLACGESRDPVGIPSEDLLVTASAPTSQGWFPFAFLVGTCEEVVEVSGRFHPLSRVHETPSGSFMVVGNLNAKGTGVGLSSGASYQWNDALPFTLKLGDLSGSATRQQVGTHTRLIGQGRAANQLVDATFTIVFSADGILRVLINRFEVRCG